MTITSTIKTMQEQNKAFEQLEPNRFKRVLIMADDMKKTKDEEYRREEARRNKKFELDERNNVWKNRR